MAELQPVPFMVGTMYDQFTDIFAQYFGGNLHFGYWESEKDDSPIEVATNRLTDLVADRLALTTGGRVLDVGCGSGKASVHISSGRGLHVVGITVSDHQLQLARARSYDEGLAEQVSFQLADATELPFEDSSFEGAYAIESILHMRDKDTVFGNLARVLRPGARLVIADFYQSDEISGNEANLAVHASQLLQIPPLITADMYREHVHRVGLQLVEFTDIREHVERSYASLPAMFQQIASTFGSEIFPQAVTVARFLEQFGIIPQVGYMLLTAVRP
ncbi:MAG: methyltransferase domain-containing protein [Pseudonocardia sp.]|nr:methyltransferase domain-containing protein [Pseudonocardia sp.]